MWATDYEINTSNFNKPNSGSGYAAYNGDHSINGVTITSSNVMIQSSKLQFKSTPGYLYNKTAMPGSITKITLDTGANLKIYVGTSANSEATEVTSGATITGNNTYFKIKSNGSTGTAYSITVTYTIPHSITYSATNGSIAGVVYNTSTAVASGASVAEGGKVTLTATPASGYAFSNWSVEGTGASLSSTTTNPTTFTMGTANATVIANFVSSSTPSIGLSTTSVAAKTAETDGTITVTYNNIASVDAEVLFYESDGTTEATYDWLDAEINTTDNTKLDYSIGENTGAARTAYMKVHQKNTDVYSALITITQEAFVVDAPTISPAAGAVTAGTTVTLTQALADQIRYTTDGSAPTKTTGMVYSAPIVVTDAITIKAIAIKNDVISDVAEAAYTITVATPECNLASSTSYLEGTYIVLTSAGNTIYYNMTIDGDTPDDPNSSSTKYTGPIALSSGNVRIKAIAYDAYNHSSGVLTRTFAGVAPATLPFNWAGGGKTSFTAQTGVVGKGLGSDYSSGTYGLYQVKFDDNGDYIQIFTSGQPGIVKVGVKTNGGTNNSSIKVQESPDGADFADVQTFEITGDQYTVNNIETTVAFATTTRVVKILFVKPNSGANVGVGPISIAIPEPATGVDDGAGHLTLTTSANMAGWRAFYNASQTYTADAKTSVFIADKAPEDSKITLKNYGKVIPAGVPVILKTSDENRTIVLTEGGSASEPADNKLIWTTSAVTDKYRLGFGASGVGFYPYSGTPASGAVILNVSSAAGARELTIDIDDDVTGISTMHNSQCIMNNEFYNLAGQRVAQPTKGLYIVNGKKVVIK